MRQGRVVLVDGTLVTTWDWAHRGTELVSGKHRDTGFNLQVAATLDGDLLAVATPVPGSWHDARAWRESGLPDLFTDRDRPEADKILNQSISSLRAAVERAIAHLKDWKILATRYRGPLDTLAGIVRTVTALALFRTAW